MNAKKFYTMYMTFIIILFIISFSVALPILFRPFYFWQVKALDIVGYSGYDIETIKTAYNEMMDFCLGLKNTFSCGTLAFSEEGMLHFVDVRNLFLLDIGLLLFSFLNIVLYWYLNNKIDLKLERLCGHSAGCNAAKLLLSIFICIVLLALPDFNAAFTMFHRIFFPGKSNWLFDPRYDQIINILPEQFFANCAIVIVVVLVIQCIYLIIKDYKKSSNI